MSERKVEVLHVVGALNLGGAETMVMNVFRNIDRTKFQFDFFLSGNSGGFYEEEVHKLGGKIYNIGRRKKHPVKYCVALYKLIRKKKYDVVQIHATDAQDGLPAVVARLAGAKKVCMFSHNTSGQSELRQDMMRKIFMWAITDRQACSEQAARWMFGEKAKANVIPLPIDCDISRYDDNVRINERKKLNIPDTVKVIGHIGRFQKQKNHIFLLDVFSKIVKRDANYRLVLIGDGVLREEIEKEIELLGLNDYVIKMGQILNASKMLSMFDLFLLPSLYEGFPTVILEAQSNGLKSIVSSTVTPSIAITDLVEFMDLKANLNEWADKIMGCNLKRTNTALYNSEIKKNYDLKKVTELFEQIYSSDRSE